MMTPRKNLRGKLRVSAKRSIDSQISDGNNFDKDIVSPEIQSFRKNRKKRPTTISEISRQHIVGDEAQDSNQNEAVEEDTTSLPPKKIMRKLSSRPKRVKKASVESHFDNFESSIEEKNSNREVSKRIGRSSKGRSAGGLVEKVIAESQQPEIRILDETEEDAEEDPIAPRNQSKTPNCQQVTQKIRGGSTQELESNNHASLKRKFEAVNKKYESLQIKYNEVLEIGIKEAGRNFSKLKKQNDEIIGISNKCLSSLEVDFKNQKLLENEKKSLEKKLSIAGTEIESLRIKLQQVESSLADSQAENKVLSAKLFANRTAASLVESVNSKAPSHAIKANGGIRMMGSVEAAQTAQAAQLKEDVYSDLTGLLMRSVTRGSEKDYFDCIQTGRNGTLHFKLAVGNKSSSESYDDIQCSYTPLLDPSRDEILIGLLPDYLVDEITFPRPHAAKFYARVVKALTEKSS